MRAAASSIASGSPSSRAQISGIAGSSGSTFAGAAHEQLGGGLGGQRRERDLALAGQPQRGLAGDQHRDGRRAREQRGHGGRGVDELLEVVEHEQQLGAVVGLQLGLEPLALVDPGQRDEAGAVAEAVRQPVGELEREPRLADAARPEHGDQADRGVAQQRRDRLELVLAADELGRGRAPAA